ncbi:hypothetical protein [Fictibacillus phosphorivorans]|uniref:hypothetical protein n=1 Tax=Fictibacillus phosphorivorans TaxID=1221500 RepID=UPI00203D0B61|nr:hypothetical protein [Fictibacillus phosphorivorans]MCM3718975.1 hypothetical protein [Fictibacillus phosphorivorans]MCM3776597.1 hypothetical protein [Fictibacillus phosphorivorans]
MKTFKMVVAAMVVLLLATPSSSLAANLAGAGSWDYLGEETLYSNGAESHVYASGGGDYMICRDRNVGPSGEVKVELWEYDPESYNDYVGARYLSAGECGIFRSIGGFVDGAQAEFFAKSRTSSTIHISFFD